MKSVAQYAAQWEATRLRWGETPPRKRPRIRGRMLVTALKRLADETGDQRFSASIRALADHGLIGGDGRFQRTTIIRNPDDLPSTLAEAWGPEHIADQVDKLHIDYRFSLSQAYAFLAADWGEPAPNFAAAMRRVERLFYREGLRLQAERYGNPESLNRGRERTP